MVGEVDVLWAACRFALVIAASLTLNRVYIFTTSHLHSSLDTLCTVVNWEATRQADIYFI